MNSELHRFRNRPLIEISEDEYLNLSEEDFKTPEAKSQSSLKRLYDGKITRDMVGIFMIELTRSYLRPLHNCDVEGRLVSVSEYKKGKVDWKSMITDMNVLRSGNSFEYVSPLLLTYPENMSTLYVPKGMTTILDTIGSEKTFITNLYKSNWNINLVEKSIVDSPQVIKDLKSMISPKTVKNNTKLSHLINKFNRVTLDKCIELSKKKT